MQDSGSAIFLSLFTFIWIAIFCLSIIFSIFSIWLTIACLVDVSKKSESEFKDRTLWIILLIISFFVPLGIILPIVYYFTYHPKFLFWK